MFVAGCGGNVATIDSSKVGRPVAVRTVAVQSEPVQRSTVQPATVHPYYQSEIYPRVEGYLVELRADIGDVVSAGDVLATIDVPELQKQSEIIQARIERMMADEQRAEAGVNLAEANVLSAEASLAESQSRLSQVDASLAAADSEYTRTEDLVQRGSLQNRMLDEVRMKRDSTRAEKTAAESSIESAKAQVTVAKAQLTAAQADADAARAETQIARRELEAMQVMIDFATIKAPIDGVVTERNIDLGDLVGSSTAAGQTMKPLFVVSRIDKVRVHIPVPESEAARVERGDQVSLNFPAFPGEPAISAAVTRLSGSLDASTRTMTVEVELENAEGKLVPGMFGQATITASASVAANVLPSRAVRFSEDGKAYVYIVDADQAVSIASVEVGFDDGGRIELLSGVQPGQQVIDAHLKRFSDGQKVRLLE